MDITTILSIGEGILAVILGGGWFLNWRAAKKKPELENATIDINNTHEAVAAANDANSILREELHEMKEINNELRDRTRSLRDEVEELKEERVVGTILLCKNATCPLRSPEYGMGPSWFDKLDRGELEQVMDNREFKEIACEKGYNVEKIK